MKKKLLVLLLVTCLVMTGLAPAMAQGVTLSLMGNANDLSKNYMTTIIKLYEETR